MVTPVGPPTMCCLSAVGNFSQANTAQTGPEATEDRMHKQCKEHELGVYILKRDAALRFSAKS